MKKGDAPILVKIISIISYVFAGLGLAGAIALIIISRSLSSHTASVPLLSILGAFGAGLLIFLAIVSVAVGVLYFFIGKGLWKGQNWARILTIIFSIFSLIAALFMITKAIGIISLLYNGAVAVYLIFIKEAKAYFKK